MLTQIAHYFGKIFASQEQSSYGSELEKYIVSKCPQSAAEIDYWAHQFDRNQKQRSWL